MTDNKYSIDYGSRVAGCKKCKAKMDKGALRIAKVTPSPFNEGDEMKLYHHPACMFETFKRARATTKIIEDPGDLEGWEKIKDEDKEDVKKLIREFSRDSPGAGAKKGKAKTPAKTTPPTKAAAAKGTKRPAKEEEEESEEKTAASSSPSSSSPPKIARRSPKGEVGHKDNSFREFRRICAAVAVESSYLSKTEVVRAFFKKGSDGKGFKGDLQVWVRLMLPGVVKRIYNVQSKQLVKIFSRITGASEEDMLEDLEAGDVAETVTKFFESSEKVSPASKATLSVHDVDEFLDKMTGLTKEEEQRRALAAMAKQCTGNDLKMVIRLIKADLKIQAGAKHILDGLHKDAYEAFNSSRNLAKVLDRVEELREKGTPDGALDVGVTLMHPVQPMLAMACKSVDMAFKKCPNGMYSELKYDGERVQLHKRGDEFKYYSRSLKPVLPHKVNHFKEFIPKAFPDGSDLILDAEVLMVDNRTGDPLPFGTLGKHKAAGFQDATPCLFVFDCIYYNGESLMHRSIRERRRLLEKHMVEVGNHVKFSEMEHITKKTQLGNMIKKVLDQGLEGLVLKDLKGPYEPGKRHWLKVKKDYLNEGAMADSADLVVLGGWYGTGTKGGIMSIFLMGCYDEFAHRWRTVTKVHGGIDDKRLEELQAELTPNMAKISRDNAKAPKWLDVTRNMTPDFVARDPKKSPVWEITGNEFTKSDIHTAAGISIRFPRITRMRDDKTWETATSMKELQDLFKASKEKADFDIDYSTKSSADDDQDKKNGKEAEVKVEKMSVDEDDEDEDYNAETDVDEEDQKSSDDAGGKKKLVAVVKEEQCVEEEKENSVNNSVVGAHSYNKVRIECPHSGMVLSVVKGDLFSAGKGVSLAHCISQDCRLGKGIAKLFRDKFGRVDEIQKMGKGVGEVAAVRHGSDRFVYNLVTKPKYSDKPTYETLRRSLEAMRSHAAQNSVKEIAMPKIGCGLDGLQWNAVRTLVKNVFLNEDVRLTVYTLDNDVSADAVPQKRSSPVKNGSVKKEEKEEGSSKKKQQAKLTDMMPKRKASDGSSNGSAKKPKKEEEEDDKDDLPDVFGDLRLVLTERVAKAEKLRRYVVAFGGEVLPMYQCSSATHVVYPKGHEGDRKEDAADDAVHVSAEWLEKSIKGKKMLDCAPFEV